MENNMKLLICESTPRQRKLLDELEDHRCMTRGSYILEGGGITVLMNARKRLSDLKLKPKYGCFMLTSFTIPESIENTMRWVKSELKRERRDRKRELAQETRESIGMYI